MGSPPVPIGSLFAQTPEMKDDCPGASGRPSFQESGGRAIPPASRRGEPLAYALLRLRAAIPR
jgi:hypothetical protein